MIQARYEGIEVGIADHDEKINEVLLLARENESMLPYTQAPVADQWEINVFMMQLLRSRYRAKP